MKRQNEDHAELVEQLGLPAQDVRLTKHNLFEYRQGDKWFPCEYWRDRKTGKLTWEAYTKLLERPAHEEETRSPDAGNELPDSTGGGWATKAEILLAGIDPNKGHLPTRGEIETRLQGLGFTSNEQAVALAVVCDGLTTQAAIARETKLDRKTVAAIVKRPQVKQALQQLQRGKLPAPEEVPYNPTPNKDLTLCNCDLHAEAMLRAVDTDNIGKPARYEWARRKGLTRYQQAELAEMPGFLRYLKSDKLTGQDVVELIRAHPAALLYHFRDCGQGEKATERAHPAALLLLESFVALLESANYGATRRPRSNAVAPQGQRRAVAAASRKILARLTKWPRATKYAYPDAVLAEIVEYYRQRIVELQAAFGSGMTAKRLNYFRKEHGREFDRYSNRELQEILKGNPLTIAARCAGKVADMKPDAFLRAYRQLQPAD